MKLCKCKHSLKQNNRLVNVISQLTQWIQRSHDIQTCVKRSTGPKPGIFMQGVGGGEGDGIPKEPGPKLIGNASAEETRFLGGLGADSPQKMLKFEILKLLEIHWNSQPYQHYVILYRFKYWSHKADLFGSWGWGGAPCALPCLQFLVRQDHENSNSFS